MRLIIAAVGRLKSGAELALVEDYAARATQAGRSLGLGPVSICEIDERKARSRAEQGARLWEQVPQGSVSVALDERGRTLSSRDFADLFARTRDSGTPAMTFLIGGPDGHDTDLRKRADHGLSFGPMVWPHMLARVMLTEQIYRAVSILSGSPYHRD